MAKTRKWILTITLLCFLVASSSQAAQETGEVINSPTKLQGDPIENQNQPILGQPSSSSPVNQPLTGFNQPSTTTGLNQPILGQPSSSLNKPLTGLNQPLTGFNQPSSSGLNQPILGQPTSSSVNQPLTGVNQPLTGFNQPSSTGFNQPISSSNLNQPFSNRLNQNSLSGNGIPFLNGNSKLEVFITKIVFVWIALLLSLHGPDMN
ncbi:unnamed protein product [Arabis nemorensis]|uniref:Uncharacterized protein n=1 Tax=Arabis nemorensis TaxID=586526 RepID=A0A565AUP5_9BRAS|nr:unnamed protein product [Arabis nemorensis]